jgi:uracil-DNA glycosylase
MNFSLSEVDSSWHEIFSPHIPSISDLLASLPVDHAPARADIFRAFTLPLRDVKVVIFGQDPYPAQGVADGLAFSTRGPKIPASLRNIFKEYSDDLGLTAPKNGDLTAWHLNGVLLLNRTLTTVTGERNTHYGAGWSAFTSDVAKALGQLDAVAILWGANARELAPYFKWKIESVHPSPLSARNGFFGSKPFSRTNELLKELGRPPIDWAI